MLNSKELFDKIFQLFECYTVKVYSNDEAICILDELANVLGKNFKGQQILAKAFEYTRCKKNARVHYLAIKKSNEDILIAVPYTVRKDAQIKNLALKNGTYCYVYNITHPIYSEHGDCFFIKLTDDVYLWEH